jgi:hypothetical protein
MPFPWPWPTSAAPRRGDRHFLELGRAVLRHGGDCSLSKGPYHDLIELADQGADKGADLIIDGANASKRQYHLISCQMLDGRQTIGFASINLISLIPRISG